MDLSICNRVIQRLSEQGLIRPKRYQVVRGGKILNRRKMVDFWSACTDIRLLDLFAEFVQTKLPDEVNCLAVIANGGIPLGFYAAPMLRLPILIVDTYRLASQVKRLHLMLMVNLQCVLVDDSILTGQSAREAHKLLEREGVVVLQTRVIFAHDLDGDQLAIDYQALVKDSELYRRWRAEQSH